MEDRLAQRKDSPKSPPILRLEGELSDFLQAAALLGKVVPASGAGELPCTTPHCSVSPDAVREALWPIYPSPWERENTGEVF